MLMKALSFYAGSKRQRSMLWPDRPATVPIRLNSRDMTQFVGPSKLIFIAIFQSASQVHASFFLTVLI